MGLASLQLLLSTMMDDDVESFDEISMLTVKEIRASVNGLLLVPHSQRMKKDTLVRYI